MASGSVVVVVAGAVAESWLDARGPAAFTFRKAGAMDIRLAAGGVRWS
jgi:hypothetical protein